MRRTVKLLSYLEAIAHSHLKPGLSVALRTVNPLCIIMKIVMVQLLATINQTFDQ
jgi:hypothetical protein